MFLDEFYVPQPRPASVKQDPVRFQHEYRPIFSMVKPFSVDDAPQIDRTADDVAYVIETHLN